MLIKSFASIIAITFATCAVAQNAAPGHEAASAAAHGYSSDGEIIVTAQRRSERLVDVPISVTVASVDDIARAGSSSIENLTKVMPGIYLQRASYGLSPTIRGVGSTLPTSGGEQNVSLYVDNIYYPTPSGNIFDLASVAGVEVLKGPQGTLFGRNATGGAILLRTLDPGFDVAGRVNLSYDRLNEFRSSGYLNVPLTDIIAVNAAIAYRYADGWVRDLVTNRKTNQGDSFTARGKLLFQPTDNFSLILTASHAKLDDPTGTDFRNLQPAPLITFFIPPGLTSNDRRYSSSAVDQFLRTQTDEYSARMKMELGAGTLSSNTAVIRNKLDARSDLSGSYIPVDVFFRVRTKTFTQEFNYASDPDQPFTYVAGIYYFLNKSRVPYLIQSGDPQVNSRGSNEAIAGYIDGTYKFGDLSVTAGVRHSRDWRKSRSAFGRNAPSTFDRFQEKNSNIWTPRFGLRYVVTEESNIYATYSKGFKSGVFEATSPDGPGAIPEKVHSFEAGFKTASSVFTFNAAAFYSNYLDAQVQATVSGAGGGLFTQYYNVPKSRIYGAEFDAWMKLNDNFDIRLAAAYTHSRYVEFPVAPTYIVDPTDPATLGGLLFSNVNTDASGNTMVRAPKFTASGTFRFETPVGDNDQFEIAVTPYYSSRVYMSFDNRLSQKPYATVDATTTLTLDDSVKLGLFGRNLTNSNYKKGSGPNALGLENALFAEPRTYGVSLGFSF
jgi:iron complex outermembrane recepter protein